MNQISGSWMPQSLLQEDCLALARLLQFLLRFESSGLCQGEVRLAHKGTILYKP